MKSWNLLLIFLALPNFAAQIYAGQNVRLDFPDAAHASETLGDSVFGIANQQMDLFFTQGAVNRLVTQPFAIKNDAIQFVRDLSKGKRVDFKSSEVSPDWRGIVAYDKTLVALDGVNLSLAVFDRNTITLQAVRSIAWENLIKPARDRGGEATRDETRAYRKRFTAAFAKVTGPKLTGMVEAPQSWHAALGVKNHAYIVASRIPSYPIVVLQCDKESRSQCLIERGCNVAGIERKQLEQVSSLAIAPEQKLLLMASSRANAIYVLKFNSCMNIQLLRTLQVSDKIKSITALFVDDKQRLWLGAQNKDDYHNASLYYWDAKQWL